MIISYFIGLWIVCSLTRISVTVDLGPVIEDVSVDYGELRSNCCSSEEYDSYCTSGKCYFLPNKLATWSGARTSCRKDYVRFTNISDSATFDNEGEIEEISNYLKNKKITKVWTSGVHCPRYSVRPISYKWTNGGDILESIWSKSYYSSGNDVCSYLALDPMVFNFSFENEKENYFVLCELKIPAPLTMTTTTTAETSTLKVITEKTTPDTTTTTTISESTTVSTEISKTSSTTIKVDDKSLRCNSTIAKGINWPSTKAGKIAEEACPKGSVGTAFWKCNANGSWSVGQPDMTGCQSDWLIDIHNEINSGKDPINIANNLAEETRKENLKLGDVKGVLQTMKALRDKIESEHPVIVGDHRRVTEFGEAVVKTSSNLLRSNQIDGWKDLGDENRQKTASGLMEEVEYVGNMISFTIVENSKELSILEENIVLQSFIFRDKCRRRRFPDNQTIVGTTSFISLPEVIFEEKPIFPNTGHGVLYNGIGSHLRVNSQQEKINSKVISFSYGSHFVDLAKGSHVEITLEHIITEGDFTSKCVFWNFTKLNWDDTGCWLIRSNRTHTMCGCSHLTNFAILMDISGNLRESKDRVMEILTLVCSSLSIVGLIVTACCLIGFRTVHNRRNTITCNLCCCLLTVNLIIIFGLKQTDKPVVCGIVAGLLHYIAIASFAWMLLEGYHLYQMVIVVFNRVDAVKFRWFFLFGYGFPLLIVIPSVAISPSSYRGQKISCWLSYENGFMWSFAGPIALIIFINMIILILALHSASNVKMKKQKSLPRSVFGWLKGSFSLMTLLGITWTIGFVFVTQTSVIFSYIFIILNGLQGVFIMIFHVILNEKVRHCLLNIVSKDKAFRSKFTSTLRTTSSHNPLHSQLSGAATRTPTYYFSQHRTSSVVPAHVTYTGHM